MTRWIVALALCATGCSTTHGRGYTWGIAVTEEMKVLLDGASMPASIFSDADGLTLMRGEGIEPARRRLLDAYLASSDFKFKESPQSPSYNRQDWPKRTVVTFRGPRHAYLDIVVETEKAGNILRLLRPGSGDAYTHVIVLRDYDRKREYWQQVDTGLVANTPGIRSAWTAFETSMRGMTTSIELPIWASRAPGSNAMPMTILVPPYSLFPELRGG